MSRGNEKQICWDEKHLEEVLTRNPAIKINKKYSMPLKGKSNRKKVIKAIKETMVFYGPGEEHPIKITFPFVYPSLNKILRMNRWQRKKLEDEFREMVRWKLKVNNIKGFRTPVSIMVIIYFPILRRRDRDNFCFKWLKDALKGIVIIDDEPRYVESEKVDFDKGEKRMEVFITPQEVR